VYGTPAHHAELAWLTNFVPKLEPALALIARAAALRLLVGGGANMLGAARPLTFIEDLAPLRDAPGAVGQWLAGIAKRGLQRRPGMLLVGADVMTAGLRRGVSAALDGCTVREATADIWRAMRRKSAAERAAVREAYVMLDAAMEAIGDAQRAGAGVTAAMLAGERAANAQGAQDVRTLFGLDGGRTLRPFEVLVTRAADPLQVYVAVRHRNYWAEGFAAFSARPRPAATKAAEVLRRAVAGAVRGARIADVVESMAAEMRPFHRHPVTAGAVCHGIGLALDEPANPGPGETFEAGAIYSLRAGVSDGAGEHAILSATIELGDEGGDVLWRAEQRT
jgi:hypothetical protein